MGPHFHMIGLRTDMQKYATAGMRYAFRSQPTVGFRFSLPGSTGLSLQASCLKRVKQAADAVNFECEVRVGSEPVMALIGQGKQLADGVHVVFDGGSSTFDPAAALMATGEDGRRECTVIASESEVRPQSSTHVVSLSADLAHVDIVDVYV